MGLIVIALWYWDQGSLWANNPRLNRWVLWGSWASPKVSRCVQTLLEQTGTVQEPLNDQRPYSIPWKWVIPLISGILKGITHPINDTYLNAESSLTTKLLPNPHNFNPGSAMSYTDPAPIGLASQHLPNTKCPETAQTAHQTCRLLQLCLVAPRYIQTTQKPSKSFWIFLGSLGAVQEPLECLENLQKSSHSGT